LLHDYGSGDVPDDGCLTAHGGEKSSGQSHPNHRPTLLPGGAGRQRDELPRIERPLGQPAGRRVRPLVRRRHLRAVGGRHDYGEHHHGHRQLQGRFRQRFSLFRDQHRG